MPNFNLLCGPVTVVTLGAVVLNTVGIDGIALAFTLASTRKIITILNSNCPNYFAQFEWVRRFSLILKSASTS